MLINAAIMSIVVTFWVVGIWRCWPFGLVFSNPVGQGICAWVASYLLSYLLYLAFFNFSSAVRAPFYQARLDPGGLFDFGKHWFSRLQPRQLL